MNLSDATWGFQILRPAEASNNYLNSQDRGYHHLGIGQMQFYEARGRKLPVQYDLTSLALRKERV